MHLEYKFNLIRKGMIDVKVSHTRVYSNYGNHV